MTRRSGDVRRATTCQTGRMQTQETNPLQLLSQQTADAVERVGRNVVALDGERRWGSSGLHLRPGVVVTTASGLGDSDEVTLTLEDGSEVTGSVRGRDETTDIAVVNFPGSNRSVAPVEIAADVRVGHWALAVARDDDGDLSAAMGIISLVSGPWQTHGGGAMARYIRADIALYPRFSGGPIINAGGHVVGLNSFGLSRRTPLVIPMQTVTRVAEHLVAHGRVARGYLGLAMQPVEGGVIVLSVDAGGPADVAGILVGDVIATLGDDRISEVDDMQSALGPDSVGHPLEIGVVRAGSPHSARVIVGQR